jgi:hypothetical protein
MKRMPNPFPGMDPWLEAPDAWGGLHSRLVHGAVESLLPPLRAQGYFADANERIWIEEAGRSVQPDVAVVATTKRPRASTTAGTSVADEPIRVRPFESELREPYLEIFDAKSRKLVTTIEFLSPTNKSTSKGRKLFERKRKELQAAGVNLVEVDLLRAGRHLSCVPEGLAESVRPWDYLVCVWRPKQADYELYPVQLRDRLPRIRVPLKPKDPDVVLDLQQVLDRAYDSGPYPDRIAYEDQPIPPLSPADAAWADERLRAAGLRRSLAAVRRKAKPRNGRR